MTILRSMLGIRRRYLQSPSSLSSISRIDDDRDAQEQQSLDTAESSSGNNSAPYPSSCSLWSSSMPCQHPYHSCYPAGEGGDVGYVGQTEGLCACSSFYGYAATANDTQMTDAEMTKPLFLRAGIDACTPVTEEIGMVVSAAVLCLFCFLFAIRRNLQTLAILNGGSYLFRPSFDSARALPTSASSKKGIGESAKTINSAGSSNNNLHKSPGANSSKNAAGHLTRLATVYLNLGGCLMGILSELCFILTALGVDKRFTLHKFVRPYLYALNGGCMMFSDALIFLTWKEVYLRTSKSLSKQTAKMPQIPLFVKIFLFLMAMGLACGYAIAQAYGLFLVSEGIACFAMVVIAATMLPVGNFVALQLLNSTSASIIYAGKRVKELSRHLALVHAAFILFNVLYLTTLKTQQARVAPMIFSIFAEAQLAFIRSAMATYVGQLLQSFTSKKGTNAGKDALGADRALSAGSMASERATGAGVSARAVAPAVDIRPAVTSMTQVKAAWTPTA